MSRALLIPATAGLHSVGLPQTYKHLFARVATIAGAKPEDLLLFGGAARDLLLKREPFDFDFMVSPKKAKNTPAKVRELVKGKKFDLTQMSIKDKPIEYPDQLRLVVYGALVDVRYSALTADELCERAAYPLGSAVLSTTDIMVSDDFLADLKARRLTIRNGLDSANRERAIRKVQLLSKTRLKGFKIEPAELARPIVCPQSLCVVIDPRYDS